MNCEEGRIETQEDHGQGALGVGVDRRKVVNEREP